VSQRTGQILTSHADEGAGEIRLAGSGGFVGENAREISKTICE